MGDYMKKKHIIGIILLITLLGTSAFGIWAYQYFIIPDPIIEAQLEEEFTIDFFDFSSFTIPSIDSEIIEDEDTTVENGKVTETQTEDTIVKETQAIEDKATGDKSKVTKQKPSEVESNPVTKETIKKKYTPKFRALEETALDRLDTLFNSAQLEYKQKKKDGTLNKTEFTRKYVRAANKLEEGVDSAFNALLDNMKTEITKHNLSTEMIKDVKQQYKEAISKKKSEYLSQATKR